MAVKQILILGASGATGDWLVQMATERGYQVTALVRSKHGIKQRSGLEIVEGDVLDAADLGPVVQGKSAVLSCLGIRRKSASSPFSPLLSPHEFTEKSGQCIVAAMKKHKVGRLIAISAAGAGDSKNKVDALTRFLFRISNLNITLRDSSAMEQVFESSGLDSLVVQPVRLIDSPASDRAAVLTRCNLMSKISRSDVAGWMLDALARPEKFEARSEMIGWR